MSTATQGIRDLIGTNLNELKTSEIREHLERVNEAFHQVDEEAAPIRREYNRLKSERWTFRNNDGRKFTESPEVIAVEDDMEPLAEKINELVALRNELVDHRDWTAQFIAHRKRCAEDMARRIEDNKKELKNLTNPETRKKLKADNRRHQAAIKRLEA